MVERAAHGAVHAVHGLGLQAVPALRLAQGKKLGSEAGKALVAEVVAAFPGGAVDAGRVVQVGG